MVLVKFCSSLFGKKKPPFIIDMSTSGHLKFQGTNRATFVGTTSNIMFDTTSTSLGIGVTGTDHPSSNLYVTGNAYVSSNIAVGGVLTMGTVNVVARHDLESVTATGNITPLTVEFTNPTTSIVASGNVEVGGELTVSGNVTDLNVVSNVNMLHTGNTASIKLNSNVVAEFPRSKKLIKYPRVAMTGPSAPTGYAASANEEQANFEAYKAFNDTVSAIGTNLHHWTSPNLNYDNNGDFTAGTAAIHTTNVGGTSKYGNWCQIELPHTFKYSYSRIRAPYQHIGRQPREGYIVGSNDLSGQWTILHKFSGVTRSTATDYSTYTPSSAPTQYFRYFRIVIEKLGSGAGSLAYAGIDEWELYGTPEYDPEAHGTDVTVKSYPNVPNTDFLDVFVDAGNASGFTLSGSDVTGVTDLSTPANTMTVNGNVTYNSANKAFVFPGTTSSYMRATLVNGNGNYPLTLSVWFMMTDYSASWRNIITVGTSGTGAQASIAYDPNQDQLYFGTIGGDIYVPHTPELGKWYHVAATFTGGSTTSSTMNVYLNGVNMGGVPNGTQTPSFTNNQFVIGGAMNSNGTTVNNPFKGQIGNTRFYRRAYSPDEIYQLYAYQKEDFGHGDLSMTLKAGRLGIGTSEPRAALDVRGASIRGPLSTFLSHDDTLQAYVNMATAGTQYLIKSAEFEIPEVYRSLGNVNLQANSTVKWMGEIANPWNTVFRLYIEYPKGVDGVITVSTGAYLGWNSRFGHGNAAISYGLDNQFSNTPETATIATGHMLEDCRCNIGDKLTVKLYAATPDQAPMGIYTNQTQQSDNMAYNERGNTNFFIALKVV